MDRFISSKRQIAKLGYITLVASLVVQTVTGAIPVPFASSDTSVAQAQVCGQPTTMTVLAGDKDGYGIGLAEGASYADQNAFTPTSSDPSQMDRPVIANAWPWAVSATPWGSNNAFTVKAAPFTISVNNLPTGATINSATLKIAHADIDDNIPSWHDTASPYSVNMLDDHLWIDGQEIPNAFDNVLQFTGAPVEHNGFAGFTGVSNFTLNPSLLQSQLADKQLQVLIDEPTRNGLLLPINEFLRSEWFAIDYAELTINYTPACTGNTTIPSCPAINNQNVTLTFEEGGFTSGWYPTSSNSPKGQIIGNQYQAAGVRFSTSNGGSTFMTDNNVQSNTVQSNSLGKMLGVVSAAPHTAANPTTMTINFVQPSTGNNSTVQDVSFFIADSESSPNPRVTIRSYDMNGSVLETKTLGSQNQLISFSTGNIARLEFTDNGGDGFVIDDLSYGPVTCNASSSSSSSSSSVPMCPNNNQVLTIPFTSCAGNDQICSGKPVLSWNVSQAANVLMTYTVPATHCSKVRVKVWVDGQVKGTTEFMGWPGGPGPLTSAPINLGLISAGNHNVQVEAEGQLGGCNTIGPMSWAGTLNMVEAPLTCPSVPQCRDGIDNDGDGRVDYPSDYGCDGPDDPTENPNPECSDNVDNADTEDVLADALDPGCHTDGNPNNPNSYDPRDPSESNTPLPQCRDGIDNDGDGRVDYNNGNGDYGCDSPDDPTENPNPECSDGVDNSDSEDTLADAADIGCYTSGSYDPRDPSESNSNSSSSSFSIDVTDGETSVDPGDDITYTIRVRNQSNQTVTNVTVTNELPSDVDFDDCSSNCSDNGRIQTWSNLTFSANEEKTFRVDGEVDEDAEDELRDTARVMNESDTDRTDVNDGDDDDDDDDDEDFEVDVTKEAMTNEVFPGGIIDYMIRIKNTGDGDIQDLVVEDRLPSGVSVVDDGNADSSSGNRLVWEIDELEEGKTWTVRYRVSVFTGTMPGTLLRNDVRVTDDSDEIDENESATVAVIGSLPQTGYKSRMGGNMLQPITRQTSESSSSPLAGMISLMVAGTVGGLKLGKKFLI